MVQPIFIFLFFGTVLAEYEGHLVPKQSVMASIGTVGIKTYFVERTMGNWTTAKSLCKDRNMNLASIRTEEERDLLANSYKADLFDGWYWTAARDARTPDQFVWDSNEEKITVDLSWKHLSFFPKTEYLTCGVYGIQSDSNYMTFLNCDNEWLYALCETC